MRILTERGRHKKIKVLKIEFDYLQLYFYTRINHGKGTIQGDECRQRSVCKLICFNEEFKD